PQTKNGPLKYPFNGPSQPVLTTRQSVVAINLLASLVHLLGFKPQRCDRPCVEAGQPDRLAGFLAEAVGPVIDPLERGVDLGDQLALPVAGAQFKRPVAFRRRA